MKIIYSNTENIPSKYNEPSWISKPSSEKPKKLRMGYHVEKVLIGKVENMHGKLFLILLASIATLGLIYLWNTFKTYAGDVFSGKKLRLIAFPDKPLPKTDPKSEPKKPELSILQVPTPTASVEASAPVISVEEVKYLPVSFVDYKLINKVWVPNKDDSKKMEILEVGIISVPNAIYKEYALVPLVFAELCAENKIPENESEEFFGFVAQQRLGFIKIEERKNHIWIVDMKRNSSIQSQNVGSVLHKFAIRLSFEKKLGGNVECNAAWGSDGFHFKFGYRIDDEMTQSAKEYDNLCEKYLSQPSEALEKSIRENLLFNRVLQHAKGSLKRDASSTREALEKGLDCLWDPNTRMERYYYFPELNCKNAESNPKEGKFKFDRDMYLPHSQKEKWERIFKIQELLSLETKTPVPMPQYPYKSVEDREFGVVKLETIGQLHKFALVEKAAYDYQIAHPGSVHDKVRFGNYIGIMTIDMKNNQFHIEKMESVFSEKRPVGRKMNEFAIRLAFDLHLQNHVTFTAATELSSFMDFSKEEVKKWTRTLYLEHKAMMSTAPV